MYKLKENINRKGSFSKKYPSELDTGYFYENKSGELYLVLGIVAENTKYVFNINNPFIFCDNYNKLEVRPVDAKTEITFVQDEPIPF